MSDTNNIAEISAAALAKKDNEAHRGSLTSDEREVLDTTTSSKLIDQYEAVEDDADDEDYMYNNLYDDDAHTPDSGSGEGGHHSDEEEHSSGDSNEQNIQIEDEPVVCEELYEDLVDEINEAREHLRSELEEKRKNREERQERRIEKKRQLMNTYMMHQEILKRIKKERDYLEDHIYQFLARRELTLKTEIKMTKDKKSRAERKLDLEWSKRLKEHRQKMDMKIAQRKIKKAKEAALKELKRNKEMKAGDESDEDDESLAKGTESESPVDGKPIEVIAKPDRKLQFSSSVVFKKPETGKSTKHSKKSHKKRKNKAKTSKKKSKAEKEKAKESKAEKREKVDHKNCTKKNPADNPYARQLQLLSHFAAQSELSTVKNAKRIAEHQEMVRTKRQEILEKRRGVRRSERERKIILRIMRFLYPEVMEKIRSQNLGGPAIKMDRKRKLKAIQAKKLRIKRKLEKEPEPLNSKAKRIEVKIAKLLKKTLEKRSKLNISPVQEEYEKVLKGILQLKLFWIECGKENEHKLNKIARRSEMVEAKNNHLLEHLLANVRDVSENSFYSSSLKKIQKSETNQFCSEICKMHQKLMQSSLKQYKLSKAVKVAKRQLKESQPKKRGRNDVQLLFEQFRVDNHTLDGKLKAKHETRDRMEYKILQVVETLAHFKEKIKFVQERLAASKTGYADLTQSVYQRRDTLANIMLEYVDTKKSERGLNAEYGILQSSRMLQDLDDTRLHCEKLCDEERDLRREYAKRLREMSNIKYQMEVTQMKAEEIKSLAIKKQKDEELRSYKQRMQEEIDKVARRKQLMKSLDSGYKGKSSGEKSNSNGSSNEQKSPKKSYVSFISDSEEEEEYSTMDENDYENYTEEYFIGDE